MRLFWCGASVCVCVSANVYSFAVIFSLIFYLRLCLYIYTRLARVCLWSAHLRKISAIRYIMFTQQICMMRSLSLDISTYAICSTNLFFCFSDFAFVVYIDSITFGLAPKTYTNATVYCQIVSVFRVTVCIWHMGPLLMLTVTCMRNIYSNSIFYKTKLKSLLCGKCVLVCSSLGLIVLVKTKNGKTHQRKKNCTPTHTHTHTHTRTQNSHSAVQIIQLKCKRI